MNPIVLYKCSKSTNPYVKLGSNSLSTLRLICAILLCMKPSNILIKLILEKYQVGESESCNNIKNAGALIGNLERILTIVFVLLGQYEAIVYEIQQ